MAAHHAPRGPERIAAVVSLALALAVIGSAAPARGAGPAAPDKAACLSAYQDGQILSRRGALAAAREKLLVCASDPCPAVLQPECVQWLADVERRAPSLVVAVRTRRGADVRDARIFVDDRRVQAEGQGRATVVDPGEHAVRVEAPGAPVARARVVAAEGEKERLVTVTVDPPDPARALTAQPERAGAREVPAITWVAVGTAVAGAATFAIFGALGNHAYGDLEACRPTCTDGDVRRTRTLYVVGDTGLAVGIVSAGVALASWLLAPRRR